MEPQAALVGADGAIELAAVAGVGVGLAVIIGPDHTEGEHSFRLHHAAQQIRLFIFGVLVDQRGDGTEDLFHGLHKLWLVMIFAANIFDHTLNISIHKSFSFSLPLLAVGFLYSSKGK